MPNWCENTITIHHDDIKMMRRVIRGYNRNRLLQEFLPTPDELLSNSTTEEIMRIHKWNDNYRNELTEFRHQLNLKYFGHKDWYSWRVANWGTKWDTGAGDGFDYLTPDHARKPIHVGFITAWSPPIEAYKRLTDLGFDITAYYFEDGMSYCGKWTKDNDEYYDIEETTSEWVRANIPREIDEQFCISENFELNEEFQ